MSKKVLRKEIAQITGLSVWEINRRVKIGKIPVLFVGKQKAVFDTDLVKEYLEKEALENLKKNDNIKDYGKIREIRG